MNIPEASNGAGTGGEAGVERLRWRCRRGMLELDLLLRDFMDTAFAQLSEKERGLFAALLDYPDPVLFDVLMGHLTPADREIGNVVEKIRAAAQP